MGVDLKIPGLGTGPWAHVRRCRQPLSPLVSLAQPETAVSNLLPGIQGGMECFSL